RLLPPDLPGTRLRAWRLVTCLDNGRQGFTCWVGGAGRPESSRRAAYCSRASNVRGRGTRREKVERPESVNDPCPDDLDPPRASDGFDSYGSHHLRLQRPS